MRRTAHDKSNHCCSAHNSTILNARVLIFYFQLEWQIQLHVTVDCPFAFKDDDIVEWPPVFPFNAHAWII